MNTAPPEDVFPLPLEAFEQYMLGDDSPEHPMDLVRQVLVSGNLQRAAFETAIKNATARHPLLRALVDSRSHRRPHWIDAGTLMPRVDWGEIGEALPSRAGQYLDLTSEVGLRIWIRQGPRAAVVTLQIHHACSDGTGAMQFITDLLAAYAELTRDPGTPRPNLPPLQPDLLRRRGQVVQESATGHAPKFALKQRILRLLRFVTRAPSPLQAPRSADAAIDPPTPFPGLVSHTFTAEQTTHLRRASKVRGATLNDLMLRDLFLVIRAWNDEHDSGTVGKWLRIAMPVNLRTEELAEMPAANVVSYGFLTRQPEECRDPDQLLDGISAETREIKTGGLPRLFLRTIIRFQWVPRWLRGLASSQRCHATVVLSNVGDIMPPLARSLPVQDNRVVAGDVELQVVRGCPPLKPKTRAVFHVMTYGGELTVAVRAWPELFSTEDTRELLERFIEQLHRSLPASDRESQRAAASDLAKPSSWEDRAAVAVFA